MGSLRVFNQQAKRFAAVGALLFATLMPALVPALVSAATVTDRSIKLSTSAKAASGVSYTIGFKAAQANTGAFVVDFCTDAAIGAACTTPLGFSASGVGTSGSDTVTAVDANTVKVVLGSSVNAGQAITPVELTGLTNPTDDGTIYARIVTYQDGTTNYHYTAADNLDNGGQHLDDGSVALSITDNIGVTGAVLESLLFCASTETITTDCSNGDPLDPPSVSLGTNGVLDNTLSEGTIHTQISTNAAKGAIVNLKSNAVGCGGLIRNGAPTACDITPVSGTAAAITPGTAKFGVKLGGLTAGTGTLNAAGNYETTDYFMNYVSGDATGVTSTYGDPIYNTNSLPVNNGAVDLTFGASTSNTTPAGNYSATLNLIATGTF